MVKIWATVFGMAFAAFVAQEADAHALRTLHSFCGAEHCKDGAGPGALTPDASGNLFGVTNDDGQRKGHGTIFEMIGGTRFKRLYTFCKRHDCSDGAAPDSPLIVDTAGNLYGTTSLGGAQDRGAVFELSPNEDRSVWTLTVLYNFCSQGGSACTDGAYPGPGAGLTYAGAASGAPYDGVSPLYGTTVGFSATDDGGVAYQLTPMPGRRMTWSQTVIHKFCSTGGASCTDGAEPDKALLVDASGNLFGTALSGGGHGYGVAFELSPSGDDWTQAVLYDFCSSTNCADGANPDSALIADAEGNLYGVTNEGGSPCRVAALDGYACGVVFKLSPDGGGWNETVLHAFCARADCEDGAFPAAALLLDSSGNLFGTTQYGGGHDDEPGNTGAGALFELTGSTFRLLHRFCALAQCADGITPTAGMAMDTSGALIGTTGGGGAHQTGGTVFRIVP